MNRIAITIFCCLAACTPLPGPGIQPASPEQGNDACGATAQAGLVGQDVTALEKVLLLQPVRIIRPGMAVTADYVPNRINFEIDGAGRIARIFCT